jgi:ribokinase
MRPDDLDVFGLGQCCIDYLGQVPEYPPPNAKCEFTDMTIQGGGPVATALVALSRWGKRCAFTGVVGDDRLGGEIARSLEQEGVDTSGVIVRVSAESQFAFIVAEPGTGRRTIFWRRPTGAPPRPDEIDDRLLRTTKVFHTDGLFPEASLAAANTAKAAGIQVSVDAGTLRDGMLELARSSDHFIASGTFARAFAGDSAPLEVCRRLAELGPAVVGVTFGEEGYAAIADGREIQGPAHAAQAVDTTGCGDVFHAGYVYGLLEGWDVERRFKFAAWAAACVAECLGGRTGIPTASGWGHP